MGTFIAKRIKKRLMIRFCVALWLLAAVVICNAYTGTITSFLALPKLKPIINNLKELAASDTYKLTAEKNSAFTDTFLVRYFKSKLEWHLFVTSMWRMAIIFLILECQGWILQDTGRFSTSKSSISCSRLPTSDKKCFDSQCCFRQGDYNFLY